MSKLPVRALPTDTVDVDGTPVEVRALSRSEVLQFSNIAEGGDKDAADNFILEHGASVTAEEARSWRESVDAITGALVIDKILELSGLAVRVEGSDPQPSTSEPSLKERSTPSTSSSPKLSVA